LFIALIFIEIGLRQPNLAALCGLSTSFIIAVNFVRIVQGTVRGNYISKNSYFSRFRAVNPHP